MGSCFSCCDNSGQTALKRAQLMKKTKSGKEINSAVKTRFFTKEEHSSFVKLGLDLSIIFSDKYSQFCQITDDLFLTGVGGVYEENVKKFAIKCIVNVTYELLIYRVKSIQSIRVPVDDNDAEDIYIYLDEVSDQINKWIIEDKKVVIHCLCGVSRSVVFVLAYLMKYKRMTLKSAYIHVKQRRNVIRPKIAFITQLIKYEIKIFNRQSFKLIDFQTLKGNTIKTPDFFPKQYPEELEREDYDDSIDSSLGSTVSVLSR